MGIGVVSRKCNARLNQICPYFTMFPLEFPYKILKKAKPNDIVLDPFCGRGTTLYAARMLGLFSYGIDSNPVAVAVSKAKIIQTSIDNVLREFQEIMESKIAFDIPEDLFWQKAYHHKTLSDICKVRQSLIKKCNTKERILLRALILGALHGPLAKNIENSGYLSNQMPRTYSSKPTYSVNYWKKHQFEAPEISIEKVVTKRLARYFKEVPESPGGKVNEGDARRASSYKGIKNVSWIITSPPYYGLDTYVTDQWLRYWFLGGPVCPDYQLNKQIDHSSPENFATALSEVWDNCAKVSRDGAIMHVRFGGISSRKANPFKSVVIKWTKVGKLQPVSGPDIDGFGCYLYLKKDIIELLKNKPL